MKIDKIFIINLKHRKDRKIHIIKELYRVGASNYEFFNAVQPKSEKDIIEWNPKYIDPIPGWFLKTGKNHLKYRLGALGCLKSHYEIMKICKQRNYDNVLILEDDTEFNFPNNMNFDQMINMLDPQIGNIYYGIIYLAGNTPPKASKQVNKNLELTKQTLTTGSYIISKTGINYTLENLEKYNKEIDVFYVEKIQQNFPCFVIKPHITRQAASYSDIAQINVNYNL